MDIFGHFGGWKSVPSRSKMWTCTSVCTLIYTHGSNTRASLACFSPGVESAKTRYQHLWGWRRVQGGQQLEDMARRQVSCWDLQRRLLVASGPLWSPRATVTDCPPGHGFLALQERRLKHGTRRAGSGPFTRRPSRCRVPLRTHSRHLSFHTWAHIF